MLGSEDEKIVLSSVIQSLDGHSSDALTNVCGKQVADIISTDQERNKKVLEGHSLEEFSVECKPDSCDCLLTSFKGQNGEKSGDLCRQLEKVFLYYKKRDLSHAQQAFDHLHSLVINDNSCCLPQNEVSKEVAVCISELNSVGLTELTIIDGLVLLSSNNFELHNKMDILNILGILALELRMPHKANKIFQHRVEQLQNDEKFVELLDKMIIWNNFVVSCAVSGSNIARHLDTVRKFTSSVKEICPDASHMCAVVLNNLGRVKFDMGKNDEAEFFLVEGLDMLDQSRWINTPQQRMWEVVMRLNISKLYSAKRDWKLAQEQLELIHNSVLVLDTSNKLHILAFVLAEQSELFLKMKQRDESVEKIDMILAWFSQFKFWSIESIFGEMQVLLLKKVVNMLQRFGKTDKAKEILQQVSDVFQTIFGSEHFSTAEVLYELGRLCCLLGDYKESASLLSEAVRIYEHFVNSNNSRLVSFYCELAHVQHFYLDERKKARENVEKAFRVLDQSHLEEKNLQLTYLTKLMKAGVLDSLSSYKCDGKSLDLTFLHGKLFSHQAVDYGLMKLQTEDTSKVHLSFTPVNDEDLLIVFCKVILHCIPLGKTLKALKTIKILLHRLAEKEGNLELQMLLHGCFGFVKASKDKRWNRCNGNTWLNEALQNSQKLLTSRRDEPPNNILLSSLALLAQTCNLMENKPKELTVILERMKDLLSLDENEDASDVYTYFLDSQLLYISAQKVLFQDKIVTVNVMVTEEFSESNANNHYPHSDVTVRRLKTDACPQKIFVLAKCFQKVDIESLRLLSRTVSESLRGSLQLGALLTTDLVVSVESLVSVTSCKALCQEIELTLPLFLKEKSMAGCSDLCELNSFSDDVHLKDQLCSSYLMFSCSRDCSPGTLFGKFVRLVFSRSDQLGVLGDISFTANSVLLFLKKPNTSILLHFLNSVVELRTKTLYPSDMVESIPCLCSTLNQTVNHILMESCASIGVELCSHVDSRSCSRLGNHLISQPGSLTRVPEKQQLPRKDETCERNLYQDIKILRRCLKRSRANVAVLQAVIEGLVTKKFRTFPAKINIFSNDPSCSNTENSESSGYPLLNKGDERFMVSHELLHADSGIDSSDSERKGAAKETVNCKYEHKQTQADMPGTCADGLPLSLSRASTDPVADNYISVSGSSDLGTQKTAISDNLATTSQTSFSSESEDSSSEGSFSIKKENVRKALYRVAEKQSVKRLCKSGKQRDVAYFQKTIHRLERKLEQKTEELNDLQRSYGEVLFERDAALRSLERIKFDIELKQRQKRLGECINGAEKLEESRDAHISGGERGDDDSSSLGSHAGGFKTREEGDYSLCVSAKALLRPEVRAKDEIASFASTAEECNQTNVTDVTDGTVVSEDVQEPHTGELPSKAKSRLFNLEFESCSVAKNSSLIVVDTGFSNSLSDVDSIRPLLYGQRLNTAGSSEDQDSCEEYFSATEGNERSYHKSYATERPSDTLTEISFKEADRSLRSNNLQKKDSGLLIFDNESPALSFCKQGSEVDCSEKLELSYTRNVKPISSWSHFVNLSQQLNGEATSLPSGVSVTASGTIYTNNPEDVKSDMTQECRTVEMKTVEDPLSLNQRAIDEAKRRFKFDFRSCDRLPKKAEGTPSGNSKYCFEICDELPPVKHDQLELKSSSSSDDDDLGVIVTQGRSSSDGDDDEDVCDGVNVTHLRNSNRVNNKATVTERVTNVFPADEKSRLIYIRQDSRSKKDNLLLSNTTVDNDNDYLESQLSFIVQSSSPKETEQRVREPGNLSSAENTGLESAFLARHSRDISLSIHSNPKSNDLSLSTECNFAETEAKLQQQQVESEVEREETWKKKQKQSETTQLQQWKTRALNGHQSGDDFQYTLNLKQSTESWKDTASSKIMPCPSNKDIDISLRDCTGDFLGNSFTTKNSNFSKDRVQGERFGNTDGEQDTDSNDVGNNKALCPSEQKSNNFEGKLQPKHEIQGSEEANGAFSQSQGESSSTLQAQVAEACALIESVYRERKAIAMEAKNRQKKLKEEWKQVQKEKEERNFKGKEITVDKGDSDGGELEDSNEKYPVQESPEWLCEHYRRRCKVKFSCCNVFHACHRCHNNDDSCPNDEAKAQNATHVQCLMCMAEQPVTESYDTQTCQSCGTKLSEYFCPKCKHFTGSEKKPYHCDKCGICRIHEDRSFHCDVCNVCLDKRLQGKHKCRPDSGHDECCICLEDAFNGCQILPCSHKVHRDCAIAMFQNGVRTCPVCRYPLYNEGED